MIISIPRKLLSGNSIFKKSLVLRVCLLLVCLAISGTTSAQLIQDTRKVTGLKWTEQGVSFGGSIIVPYIEFGYYRGKAMKGGRPLDKSAAFVNFGGEYYRYGKVFAPKIQFRFQALFFTASLSAVYFTSPERNYGLAFRPEAGFGGSNFDVTVGINLGPFEPKLEQVPIANLQFRYYLNIGQKKYTAIDKDGEVVY